MVKNYEGKTLKKTLSYLLQIKLPLNVLEVTGFIGDGFGQLSLNVGQPRAKAAHVLIELLHSHQSLSQLLHSINKFMNLCRYNPKTLACD